MAEPVHTLQIIKSLGRGGAETLLSETYSFHDRTQFTFHYIYFLPWKNQLVGSIEKQGAKVCCLPATNNIQLLLKAGAVANYVKKNNIRLIHAHLPWAGVLARIVGKMTGVPVIYTEHNKLERYHFLTRWLNVATYPLLTCIVSVSYDVEKSIRQFSPKLRTTLQTILNGVNVEHFAPNKSLGVVVRRELNVAEGAIVFGTVAVFRTQKRLDIWIGIAAEIIKERPQVRFIIVGDGPMKDQLINRIRELNLSERIFLVGLKEEVRPYLAAMDVYMMSSVFEGLPVALLEAMSMGLPVASTNAGGIKEVVRDGIDGLLCDVQEPEKLKYLAFELIDAASKRDELGRQARRRIIESFSMKRMVSELENLYKYVLQ